MKGNYFLGSRQFQVREMSFPPLGDFEVKIQNMAAGICGTDIHIYHGEKGSAEVTPPVVLGHEYAGVVVETGRSVTTVRVGDHVTVDPNIYCGTCPYCKAGKKQLCSNLVAVGVNFDGGFAQYSVVPEAQVYRLNPEVSFAEGAMAEPLACCIHGVELAGIELGDTVCVIGGGAIGLLMVQLARLKGAARVILSEPVENRRRIGLTLGADYAFNPLEKPLDVQLRDTLGIAGAQVVIECVGKTFATQQAVSAADKGATVLLFSVPQAGAEYGLPLFEVYQKELTVKGSFINPDTHQKAVNLINSGKIKTAPLITHQYPLSQLEAALFKQMDSDSIKVQVLPQE